MVVLVAQLVVVVVVGGGGGGGDGGGGGGGSGGQEHQTRELRLAQHRLARLRGGHYAGDLLHKMRGAAEACLSL